ncbi:hypothetical protein ACH5RR_012604 [Cinchona calisaya]|uniref:Late blight resistance protein homolog R1A-3 n=1 Tax=Cinchona calisaya TaxID=153742 RepID=A0ABD3A9V1_9GENT
MTSKPKLLKGDETEAHKPESQKAVEEEENDKAAFTSNSACFDFALDCLDWLLKKSEQMYDGKSFTYETWNWNNKCHLKEDCYDSKCLKLELRLLKTFLLCARNYESLGCSNMSFRIQDEVSRIPKDIHSASIKSGVLGAGREIRRFRESIILYRTDIKKWYNIFLDDHYSLGYHDPGQFVDSIIETLVVKDWSYWPFDEALCGLIEALKENLIFLKNLISFATMQGVDQQMQLMDLLIQVRVVAIKSASLIYACWFDRYYREERNKMQFGISRLLQKIKPFNLDPQVRETYVQVLTASKLSRSSPDILNWNIVVADFVDSLLSNLIELQEFYSIFIISVKDQIRKLHEGLRFLRILLLGQMKFNLLTNQMKDLIRVGVCDSGIIICSLFVSDIKEGFAMETDIELFDLLKLLKFVMAEAAQIYPLTSSSSFGFPKTNELGSVDFLLENLKELANCEADSIAFPKDQILRIHEDLVSLRSFLHDIAEQRNQNEKLQDLWSRVVEVAYKAEFVIDSIIVGDKPDCSPLSLDTITKKIKFLMTEIDSARHEYDTQAKRVSKTYIHMPSQGTTPVLNEVLVGLDEEVETIIDRLTRGSKQLDVVSLVGMPGLGKTTLANKVYHNAFMCHFHIRAWCTVSQVYSKYSLLLQILVNTAVFKSPDQYLKMDEDDLAEKLYKCLKGNRYLIVLDDVWDIDAWNLLKVSFPNDENGSRILFTSRFHTLCSLFKFDSKPHHLRPLTDEESWELLQKKLFGKECCPSQLSVVGMQIARNCKGLPLTVVLVAGVLANTEQDCWEEVANSLSSSTVIGTEHCMKTLELSYRHLPDYLKSCLLYFGAFQEDQDIPVRRLLRLWISEGFVRMTEAKSLEDVADEYLMALIDRSLVMVTQLRSIGGVKFCRVHDLLHEFCLAKSKEESFLQILHGRNELFTSTRPYNPHRLCYYSSTGEELKQSRLFFPHLRCLLFFPDRKFIFGRQHEYSFIFRIFKLLRVLDFGEVDLGQNFPWEVEMLVHLRYLAIQCYLSSIPSGIANLSRLETLLIVGNGSSVALPNTIWNMKKLRHLCCRSGFRFPTENFEVSPDLYHLDTCTLAIDRSSKSLQMVLRKLPSIRRLKCVGSIIRESSGNCERILMLDFLSRLQSLHVVGLRGFEFAFPLNLKKLTLSACNQPWSDISTVGKLPNLEVLKLLSDAFVGETWEMEEGEFSNLRILKLKFLDIVTWTASCDIFPNLQKLVLYRCWKLEEVPSCLGDSPNIEMIELNWCSQSAESSVKQIQENQMEMGNEGLKIVIH